MNVPAIHVLNFLRDKGACAARRTIDRMASQSKAAMDAHPDIRPAAPPRSLEILGNGAVGTVHLRRHVCRPGRRHRLLVLRQGGPFDMAAAIHVVAGGLTISLSVIMGLPAVLAAAWIAIRPTRTPVCGLSGAALDLVEQFLHRRCLADAPGRRLGFGVARARARGDAGLYGRGAEIGAGRRRVVAVWWSRSVSPHRCRKRFSPADFSIAAGRNPGLASSAPSSCRRWRGRRCICSTIGSFSARYFPSACCSAICAIAATRPG